MMCFLLAILFLKSTLSNCQSYFFFPTNSSTEAITQLSNGDIVHLQQLPNNVYLFTLLDDLGGIPTQITKVLDSRGFIYLKGLTDGGFLFLFSSNCGATCLKYEIYDNNFNKTYGEKTYKALCNGWNYNSAISLEGGGFIIFYYDQLWDYSINYWGFFLFISGFDQLGLQKVPDQQFGSFTGCDPHPFLLKNGYIWLTFHDNYKFYVLFTILDVSGKIVYSPRVFFEENKYRFEKSLCSMQSGNVFLGAKLNYQGLFDGFYSIFSIDGDLVIERTLFSAKNPVNTTTIATVCLTNGNAVIAWGSFNATNSSLKSFYVALVNDSGIKITDDIYVMDAIADSLDLYSFADDSILLRIIGSNFDGSPGFFFQYMNSDLRKLYAVPSCLPPLAVSNDRFACVKPISGCISYFNNGSCQTCDVSKILTVNLVGCADPIQDCMIYSDDQKCKKCKDSYLLTRDKENCRMTIAGCLSYSDDKYCESCEDPMKLTVGGLACVNKIDYCSLYSQDKKCLSCQNGRVITTGNWACAALIANCSTYSDDTFCQSCQADFALSQGRKACARIVTNCAMYDDNKICSSCYSPYAALTAENRCILEIKYCVNYSIEETCLQCSSERIPSFNKSVCVKPIPSCKQTTDTDRCIVCFDGTLLSLNRSMCVEDTDISSNQYKKTIQAKIVILNSKPISNTVFLSKEQNSNLSIINNFDTFYQISLFRSYIVLSNEEGDTKFKANFSNGIIDNSIEISMNLSQIPSSTYKAKIDIHFSLISGSDESEDMPDDFVITFQPKNNLFVGSDAEITNEIKQIQTKLDEEAIIIGVTVGVGGFIVVFLLVWLFCYLRRKRNERIRNNYLDTTQSKNLKEKPGEQLINTEIVQQPPI